MSIQVPGVHRVAGLRRVELDVMKPSDPSIVDVSKNLSALKSVENVDVMVMDVERKVEKLRIILEGENLDFDDVRVCLESMGAVIHAVDRVCRGSRIIEPIARLPFKK